MIFRLPKKRTFLNQFLNDTKMIGSVRPSSRFLAKKMLQNINFDQDKILVELGPGTGVFTFEIIDKMHRDAKLLVFELNKTFIRNLKKQIKDDRVILINDSAEKINYYLNFYNLEKADIIISSLPLSNFDIDLKKNIVENSNEALKDTGLFIQFQYSLSSKEFFKSIFRQISISFTFLNLPPAFIYSCKKNNLNRIKCKLYSVN